MEVAEKLIAQSHSANHTLMRDFLLWLQDRRQLRHPSFLVKGFRGIPPALPCPHSRWRCSSVLICPHLSRADIRFNYCFGNSFQSFNSIHQTMQYWFPNLFCFSTWAFWSLSLYLPPPPPFPASGSGIHVTFLGKVLWQTHLQRSKERYNKENVWTCLRDEVMKIIIFYLWRNTLIWT